MDSGCGNRGAERLEEKQMPAARRTWQQPRYQLQQARETVTRNHMEPREVHLQKGA